MQGVYTVLLLIVSNLFMTFAWYGHLKLQETKFGNLPLYGVILFFVGNRSVRILFSSAGEPDRIP